MDTPSTTCDESSEVAARDDYGDIDAVARRRGRPRREASSDVSSECSGEPGSPYGSPYPRWPVCSIAKAPPPPLLQKLGAARRGAGRDRKAGDGGTSSYHPH